MKTLLSSFALINCILITASIPLQAGSITTFKYQVIRDVSSDGTVVGAKLDITDQAFYWKYESQSYSNTSPQFLSSQYSVASAISDDGKYVFYYEDPNNGVGGSNYQHIKYHINTQSTETIAINSIQDASYDGNVVVGAKWSVAAGAGYYNPQILPGPTFADGTHLDEYRTGQAYAITHDGNTVVGAKSDGDLTSEDKPKRPFIWTQNTGIQYLGSNPGAAYDIDSTGQYVVGGLGIHAKDEAYIWDKTNQFTNLGTLGGSKAVAIAISDDASIVVGNADNENNISKAFIWHKQYGMQDLFEVLQTNNIDLSDWDITKESSITAMSGNFIVGYATSNDNIPYTNFVIDMTNVQIPEPTTIFVIAWGLLIFTCKKRVISN